MAATASKEKPRSRPLIIQAIIAGAIGGIIVEVFLMIERHLLPIALETRNAALFAGPGASPLLGVGAHFAIAIFWAVVYAYAFREIAKLQDWFVGAIVLGITVNAFMTLVITTRTGTPWDKGFVADFIPNVVFYAFPVTFYLSHTVRRTHPRGAMLNDQEPRHKAP